MPFRSRKPDESTKNGVSRSLRVSYTPDTSFDPELEKLIRHADGIYTPDEVSDQRVKQLIERLEQLPWGHPETE